MTDAPELPENANASDDASDEGLAADSAESADRAATAEVPQETSPEPARDELAAESEPTPAPAGGPEQAGEQASTAPPPAAAGGSGDGPVGGPPSATAAQPEPDEVPGDEKEIPELVVEFKDLAVAYLRQETLETGKRLGRYTGFSLGAGCLFALAGLFFAVAVMRAIIEWLPGDPTHQMWSALGYILAALVLLAALAIIAAIAGRTADQRQREAAE